MKVLIVGLGGVGGYYGGLLALSGIDTTFLVRSQSESDLRQYGLHLQTLHGDFDLPIQVKSSLSKEDQFDLICVCVKSYDTPNALSKIKSNIADHTTVLLLQNGIDRYEQVKPYFSVQHVLGATCNIGVHSEGMGCIRHVAKGELILGEIPGGRKKKEVLPILEIFKNTPIHMEWTSDFKKTQWKKWLWNLGFNAPTALVGASVEQTLEKPEMYFFIKQIIEEGVQLARKEGVPFSSNLAVSMIQHTQEELSKVMTSMAWDRLRDRKLELDLFQGECIGRAKLHSVVCPANTLLLGILSRLGG